MAAISTRAKSPVRSEAILKALQRGPVYCTGVLLGNWVEDRIECPKKGTLYFPPKEIKYDELKPESRQPDFRQNKLSSLQVLIYCTQVNLPSRYRIELRDLYYLIFKNYNTNPDVLLSNGNVHAIIRHDSHDSCGNYATTTDLVYNHLPKPLCGPQQRYYKRSAHQFYPQPDLFKCFGNATEWGLRKYLQHEWKCTDVSDYASTLYEDTYIPPKPHQYLQRCERKARNSSFTKSFRFKMTKSKK